MARSQVSAFRRDNGAEPSASMADAWLRRRAILKRKSAPGFSACVELQSVRSGQDVSAWTRSSLTYSAASTRGRSRPWRSRLISSAIRKASSSACSALRRGSQIGVVAVVQIGVGQGARAAGAFGDVLAGHLEMDAAGMRALRLVDGEEVADLLHDHLEGPRLVAGARLDGVAVHRIARPHDGAALALHRAHQRRQLVEDLVGAEAADQRQPARLVLRVEDVDQLEQLVRRRATARISGRSGS